MTVPASNDRSRYWPLAVVAIACMVIFASALIAGPTPVGSGPDVAAAVSRASAEIGELFVYAGPELWLQPAAVYPGAALLRLGIPADIALRLPAALAGVLTVVLTFVLTTGVSGDRPMGAAAAALLLLMPAFHVYAARPGAELLMVPLVLAWLASCVAYRAHPRLWVMAVGGAALGTCVYTQPAGVLAGPVFFALGAVIVSQAPYRTAALACGAVAAAVTLVPAVWWVAQHPQVYGDTFGRWAIHAAHIRDPLDGVIAFTRWPVVARRAGEYWHYFNPTFLFSSHIYGLIFAVLLPIGLWGLRRRSRPASRLLIACALLAPVPAVLLDAPRDAGLVLLLLPVGAAIAAIGIGAVRELTHPAQ